jgi:hypothetical protein
MQVKHHCLPAATPSALNTFIEMRQRMVFDRAPVEPWSVSAPMKLLPELCALAVPSGSSFK